MTHLLLILPCIVFVIKICSYKANLRKVVHIVADYVVNIGFNHKCCYAIAGCIQVISEKKILVESFIIFRSIFSEIQHIAVVKS